MHFSINTLKELSYAVQAYNRARIIFMRLLCGLERIEASQSNYVAGSEPVYTSLKASYFAVVR